MSTKSMIYLDHNATTPVAPEVLESMLPYFTTEWGNPSSSYRFGSKLKSVLEQSREQVADLFGAHPMEVLFTSCGTESNNTAIHSALKSKPEKKHIITSAVEHSSVLNYCKTLEQEGYRVTYLPVDQDGILSLADLENAICDDTAVVSLMWANNETGVLFPVDGISKICAARAIPYHCDAVQAIGKLSINLKSLPIDYLSLTGHKLNAPKGIAALYVRRKTLFSPYFYGGHQERERRGGTENVPLIVGLGVAATLANQSLPNYAKTISPLRNLLETLILREISGTKINGKQDFRISNTTNINFEGIEAEAILILLDKNHVYASSGSACLAESDEPSHVIDAMRPKSNAARQSVRFSLGKDINRKDIEETVSLLKEITARLRN